MYPLSLSTEQYRRRDVLFPVDSHAFGLKAGCAPRVTRVYHGFISHEVVQDMTYTGRPRANGNIAGTVTWTIRSIPPVVVTKRTL